MAALSGLVNLMKLDLEKCPGIHGGLIHIKGLTKLESLSIKWCNCITDADMKPLSGLTNLKSLQISCSKVTDFGITYLKGLQNLSVLNLEGCPVTASCFDTLSALFLLLKRDVSFKSSIPFPFPVQYFGARDMLVSLLFLNLSRCNLSDDGCEKLSKLGNLKVLNLGFNDISDACLIHLKGLQNLKCLELSDTEVGSNGLRYLSG
ncbi:F-box/LRR-repeat 16 [Gossypium arboreum]|uniref:F-box/LRR-repeat 16 n=1 Tax=Gossypium arboreum TaxID=29729 RepID=A0A0B0N8B0_GOSAR|nr:F-box/LRR-repeat 16 [Gossypium arboreum]